MDVLTHLFIPYTAALALYGLHRRSPSAAAPRHRFAVDPRPAAGAALVFGLAGASPDLDSVYSFLKTQPGLWWLQHRGISHTLVGAPLHGFVVVGILHLVARRWPERFGVLRFRPLYLVLALLGSWSHLAIDGITYSGTPALFPFHSGRYTLPVFHWLVDWMFVFWVVFLVVKLWRRGGPEWTVRAGAVAVVLLVVLTGVRVSTMPDVGEDEILMPRASPFEWTVLRPHENGSWEASLLRGGDETIRRWYADSGPRDDVALAAMDVARRSGAYKGFEMGLFGPVVVHVTPEGDGTNVTFIAVAQRFEVEAGMAWTPADPKESWGVMELLVQDDEVRVIQRGW